jgi:uncharacterized protein (TIGR02246 family)
MRQRLLNATAGLVPNGTRARLPDVGQAILVITSYPKEISMKRIMLLLVLWTSVAGLAIAKQPTAKPEDEAAVRAMADAYLAAYGRGDAKAAADLWSEKGEWVTSSGQRAQGRAAIREELDARFAEDEKLHLELVESSVRFVTADVAIDEGRVRVTQPGQDDSESTYIAVAVKKDGQWKLDSLRETDLPEAPTSASPLNDLAWLVGEWTDAGGKGDVSATVAWTKNKSFLSYSFKVAPPGADDLEGTQVIGWDPAAGTIRSWMFDSDGGFGEGTWSKKDNRWTIKFKQVLPDGRKASATNIYTIIDHDTITWQSIGREVDGQFMPNVGPVKVIRKGKS